MDRRQELADAVRECFDCSPEDALEYAEWFIKVAQNDADRMNQIFQWSIEVFALLGVRGMIEVLQQQYHDKTQANFLSN